MNILKKIFLLILLINSVNINSAFADFGSPETISAALRDDGFKIQAEVMPDGTPVVLIYEFMRPAGWENWPTRLGSAWISMRKNGTWTTPEVVVDRKIPRFAELVADAKLLVGPDGTLTIVFKRAITSQPFPAPGAGGYTYSTIEAVTRDPNSGLWGTPVTLTPAPLIYPNPTAGPLPSGYQDGPYSGITANGTIFVFWQDSDSFSPNYNKFMRSVRPPGGGFTAASAFTGTIFPGNNFNLDLSVAPDGGVAISFITNGNGIQATYVMYSTSPLAAFSAQEIVSPNEGTYTQTQESDVTIASGGKIVAMWQQYDTALTQWKLRYNTKLPGNGWSGAQLMTPDSIDDGINFELETTGNGTGVALWVNRNGRALSSATSALGSATFSAQKDLTSGAVANFPYLFTLKPGSGGSAIATWTILPGTNLLNVPNQHIQAAILSDTGWGDAKVVSALNRAVSDGSLAADGTAYAYFGFNKYFDSGATFFRGLEAVSTGFAGSVQTPVPTAIATPTGPGENPTVTGSFVLSGKTFKSSKGNVALIFNCNGEADAACNGSAELYTLTKKGKGKNKKIVKKSFGTCSILAANSPAQGTCSLKLKGAAKSAIKDEGKFKAKLGITSVGISQATEVSVTIK